MAKPSRNWGPLHPVADETERLAKSDLPRERQLEIYRYLKLNRMTEDRLSNLYRQGKVVGGLYSSRGQEAVSVGSAYAIHVIARYYQVAEVGVGVLAAGRAVGAGHVLHHDLARLDPADEHGAEVADERPHHVLRLEGVGASY